MFKKFTSAILAVCLLFLSSYTAFATQPEAPSQSDTDSMYATVTEYFDCLANRRWNALCQLLAYEDREEFEAFIQDITNQEEHIGYFNYAAVELVSCVALDDELMNLSEITPNKLDNYSNWICWECSVDVTTYSDTKYLSTGLNLYQVYTAIDDEGNPLVIETLRFRDPSDLIESGAVYSYDAPVAASGTGVWQNPTSIIVEDNGEVDFDDYCYRVTAQEFGTDSFSYEAKKAVALAVKQYGWNRTLVQKYPNYEFDVRAGDSDQVYISNITVPNSVVNAVNDIWDYVMLTCDLKLFCSFHTQSISSNSHAKYHGGVLSHVEANSLGTNSNYSWTDILHYFYDYGTYNNEMTQGVISIVNLNHASTNSNYYISGDLWYHYSTCLTCGCVHYEYHNWTYTGSIYRCTDCGMTSSYIPSVMRARLAEEISA